MHNMIYRKFFGYFEEANMAAINTRHFFEEQIKKHLTVPKWTDASDKLAMRECILQEYVILNVELERLKNSTWKHFVRQQSKHLFSNGRLVRVSVDGFDQHFAICVGPPVDMRLKVLMYRKESHSEKGWEDWQRDSQLEEERVMARLMKFLNRFGCILWRFRENKPLVDGGEEGEDVDEDEYDEKENQKYAEKEWLEEDKQLLEILISFLKINPKLWTSAVGTAAGLTSGSLIDWVAVAKMVYHSVQRPCDRNPENTWWEGRDSVLETRVVELKDVDEVYDVNVLPKHDLGKE